MCVSDVSADVDKAPSPLNKKGCCSTRRENNVALKYLKNLCVYDVDLWKEREGRKERTVLLLILFNTVSDDNVIILKCTIYRDVFHSWKSLYASLWNVTILFTWYNITLCFCTVTDVRAIVLFVLFFLCMTRFVFVFFIFNTASVILLSQIQKKKNKKWNMEVKKWKSSEALSD